MQAGSSVGVEHDFSHFVEWAFYGIVGGASVFAVNILAKLRDSVEALNVRVAVIIEKTETHEKILERHEGEIKNLTRGM